MRKPAIITSLLLLLAGSALAQTFTTAQEIMDAVSARPEPVTLQATLDMTITSANGQSLSRALRMWSEGDDRRVIKFIAPADIAGSGFLSLERPDGSSENMIYLPALDRVRRIAGGQQGDSFFGSDFSYSDMTGIDPDEYSHSLLETRDGPTYIIEAVPLPDSESPWERLLLEVPHDTLIPARVDYYLNGTAVRTLTTSDVSKVDGYLLARERRMDNLHSGSHTVIRQSDVTLDEDVPAEVFSERFLRR